VSGYSTGMKQRLGIAAALLGDPDLLILDEPTNGLDPAGIQEMRGFIRGLADRQNRTVFLSSHLLNEVEQVCDRVAIIYEGKIVREGAVADLLAEGRAELRVQASPPDRAAEVLREGWAVSRDGGQWLTVSAQAEDQPHIISRLVAQGISIHQVVVHRPSLEEFYMAVTQAKAPAGGGDRK
jgi:ABC-2 type transport system ATP-binding protein